jgi:hypothetical protein
VKIHIWAMFAVAAATIAPVKAAGLPKGNLCFLHPAATQVTKAEFGSRVEADCTAVIQSAVFGGSMLAYAYERRAISRLFFKQRASQADHRTVAAAIDDLEKAILIDPTSAETFLVLGKTKILANLRYFQTTDGKAPATIAPEARVIGNDIVGSFTEAIRLDPKCAEAYAMRADLRSWLGDTGVELDRATVNTLDPEDHRNLDDCRTGNGAGR